MPVYDGQRFLAEALDSLLAQDFGDLEPIVSDNESTDATRDICEDYTRRDTRVTYSRLAESLGTGPNHNRLVDMSNCELFKWTAHDDRKHPEFLSRCIAAYDSFEPPPAVVHPEAEFIDENGLMIEPETDRMHADSRYSFIIAPQALQAMSRVAPMYGVFGRETPKKTRLHGSLVSSDYVFLLETALVDKVIHLKGEPLFQRRIRSGMATQAHLPQEARLHFIDPKVEVTTSYFTKLYLEYLRAPVQMNALSLA